MPATPSEASTEAEGFDDVEVEMGEPRGEEEGVGNQENEEPLAQNSSPFNNRQPPYLSFSPSQVEHLPSGFEQPPVICLSPPAPPPLAISPTRPLPGCMPEVGTIIPPRIMDSKQRLRQRRKARDQKRRERRRGELEQEEVAKGGLSIDIGSGTFHHCHIGPITFHVARK